MTRPTFQLNGRTYDAITGAVIGTEAAKTQTTPPVAVKTSQAPHPAAQQTSLRTGLRQPARHAAGPSMDGMMKPARPATKPLAVKHAAMPAPKHVNPHRPQPTRTLMRRAVKAPSHAVAAATAQPAVQQAPHSAAAAIRRSRGIAPTVTPKLSSSAINPRRAQLAGTTDRNQAVQRFAPAPQHKPWTGHAATTVSGVSVTQHHPVQTAQTSIASIPVKQPTPQAHNSFAKPTRRPSSTAHHASAAKQQYSAEDDGKLFEQALAQARSHEQAAPAGIKSRKSRRRTGRIMAIAGAAAVFMGLIGFVAYQNQEDIRLQLASAKAGFSASAPLYKPDGYALSSMQYTAGSVASVYRHGTSNDFTITQKKSNWDSQTLLENFVATKSGDYKGYQMNGRSVYVYGDGNATWVNGGIWYQIKATGNIDDQQLVRIAASM